MGNKLSKTQIDKLGDRLRQRDITEEDLRMLDDYRRSFSEAYEFIVGALQDELRLEPTGRPAKSTTSISEKLIRESIRLTQVQDIAGCRLVVADIASQDRVVESVTTLFKQARVSDRREHPSHGYRAVHVILKHRERLVEIQVRTVLQHSWAELSEKISDVVDPGIKYGIGNQGMIEALLKLSTEVAREEAQEVALATLQHRIAAMLSEDDVAEARQEQLINLQDEIKDTQMSQVTIRDGIVTAVRQIIQKLLAAGGNHAVSD
jgi:GTP pyrophosphokinase